MKNLLSTVLPSGKFWTDAWSLVEGCTPVSPGCTNCWLAALEHRFGRHQDRDCLVNSNGVFTGAIRLRDDRLDIPLRARKPRAYAIWSDLFHEGVSERFRDWVFNRMSSAKNHHFIIVTKRPQEAVPFLERHIGRNDRQFGFQKWPLANITILVTMEDQQRADERAPHALQLAGMGWRVGALCEPLLGPVRLDRIHEVGKTSGGAHIESWESALNRKRFDFIGDGPDIEGCPKLSWVITGGESGPGARPVHPDWVRSLRDQAQAAGVPFLFKQWGEWHTKTINTGTLQSVFRMFESKQQWINKGNTWVNGGICLDVAGKVLRKGGDFDDARYPVVVLHKRGKKLAGRTLDGREWLEVPE